MDDKSPLSNEFGMQVFDSIKDPSMLEYGVTLGGGGGVLSSFGGLFGMVFGLVLAAAGIGFLISAAQGNPKWGLLFAIVLGLIIYGVL